MAGIDSFTKLMLHMNSDFSDSSNSGHTPTVSGATIDTSIKKFGAGSGNFVRASSQVVTYPDSADWDFGNGNFTLDCWLRFTTLPADSKWFTIVSQNNEATSGSAFWFGVNNVAGTYSLSFNYWLSSWTSVFRTWITPVINTWYHLATARNGADLKLFVGGTQIGTTYNISTDTIASSALVLSVGGESPSNRFYTDGKLDELRISKGIARWTSNFTPPVSEYTLPFIYPEIQQPHKERIEVINYS